MQPKCEDNKCAQVIILVQVSSACLIGKSFHVSFYKATILARGNSYFFRSIILKFIINVKKRILNLITLQSSLLNVRIEK